MPVRIDEVESRVEVEPGAAAAPQDLGAIVRAVVEALRQDEARNLRREMERRELRLRARDFDD